MILFTTVTQVLQRKIATSCCDLNGKNSYELLLDTIDPNLHNNILDLACGSGVLLEYCNKRFPLRFNLYGVDMNENELKLARNRPLNKNAIFIMQKFKNYSLLKTLQKM